MSIQEKTMYASFWKEMAKVNTCIPARIVKVVSLEEMIVDVQPLVNMKRFDGTEQEWATILNVPYILPSTSTSSISYPVNVGDTVLLVFSMSNIENFQIGNGTPTAPVNHARFSENDAIAITGLFPRQLSTNRQAKRNLPHDNKDLVVAHNIGTENEIEVRLRPDGSIGIKATKEVKVEAPKIESVSEELIVNTGTADITSQSATVTSPSTSWTGDINLTGNLSVTGGVTATLPISSSVSVGAPTLSAASSLSVAGKEMSGHSHNVTGVQSGNSTVVSGAPN